MNDKRMPQVVKAILTYLKTLAVINVETSGRHVHLDRQTIDALFGEGYQLTKKQSLSQPGQFACEERLILIGPKGKLENVVVLGPERSQTQVEVSLTDGRTLGIQVPIRESGDLALTPGIKLQYQGAIVPLENGLIVAKRHIHMTEGSANYHRVINGELVKVAVKGERPLIFDDVLIRVSPNYATSMHIDYDEGNACGYVSGVTAKIIKKDEYHE